jgi:hypothetical protein
MFAWILGWGKWEAVKEEQVNETRIHHSPDPYCTFEKEWRAEGVRVLLRRQNKRTGLVQYRYKEFLK